VGKRHIQTHQKQESHIKKRISCVYPVLLLLLLLLLIINGYYGHHIRDFLLNLLLAYSFNVTHSTNSSFYFLLILSYKPYSSHLPRPASVKGGNLYSVALCCCTESCGEHSWYCVYHSRGCS
jgi:hypothetical protein